jgi:hypothetical protein
MRQFPDLICSDGKFLLFEFAAYKSGFLFLTMLTVERCSKRIFMNLFVIKLIMFPVA